MQAVIFDILSKYVDMEFMYCGDSVSSTSYNGAAV